MECIAQLNQMNFAPTEKGKTMAENYKHLYEQTKKMLAMYQDELVPGFRKQIEEMEAKNKWIPVSERLPERGQKVIIYTGNIQKPTVLAYQFWNPKYDTWAHVTHWMPLPSPPEEKDDSETKKLC